MPALQDGRRRAPAVTPLARRLAAVEARLALPARADRLSLAQRGDQQLKAIGVDVGVLDTDALLRLRDVLLTWPPGQPIEPAVRCTQTSAIRLAVEGGGQVKADHGALRPLDRRDRNHPSPAVLSNLAARFVSSRLRASRAFSAARVIRSRSAATRLAIALKPQQTHPRYPRRLHPPLRPPKRHR